jgi:hypothetical protein
VSFSPFFALPPWFFGSRGWNHAPTSYFAGEGRSCRADFPPGTSLFRPPRHSYADIGPTTADGGIANRVMRLRIAKDKFRTFGDDDDVADLVAERRYLVRHPHARWAELAPRSRRRARNRAKRWLNTLAVDRMTAQQFAERDPAGEIRQWLTAIAEMVASAS